MRTSSPLAPPAAPDRDEDSATSLREHGGHHCESLTRFHDGGRFCYFFNFSPFLCFRTLRGSPLPHESVGFRFV